MARKLLAILVIDEILHQEAEERKNKRKRIWMKEWLKKRPKFSHVNLLRELEATAIDDYRNFLRMDSTSYAELLNKVAPYILKQDTILRDAISPNKRLSTTLRFLATGESFASLQFKTYISQPSISNIIVETCNAIIKVLKDYIQLPKDENEWKSVAEDFAFLWNFPNCLGAIDGKHVTITKPPGSGSYFFNYKKTFSIVLMALVNAKYEFLMVHVGTNGNVSDGGVFGKTQFKLMLEEKALGIPEPRKLDRFGPKLPYVFVADGAFPLRENIMKPFSGTNISDEQQHFNKRLSRARGVVENTFGILASRFRILLTTIHLSPEKTTKIVLAICNLHNFLRTKSPAYYNSVTAEALHIDAMLEMQATMSNNSTNIAKNTRENFCNYFNNADKISNIQ